MWHPVAEYLSRIADAQLDLALDALGAVLIEANFPRAYIDPNRSLADIDPGKALELWMLPQGQPPRRNADRQATGQW